MDVFLHLICYAAAGFFAAWAVSINEVRMNDKIYDSRWVWLLVVVLFAIAFGVANINA